MAARDPEEFLETITALAQVFRAAAARTYATFEVGSAQAKFLRHIGEHGRMSQADLARATETHPALTGRALESLIERGWVRRKRNEDDRRQYVLELTASGQRVRERVDEARRRIAANAIEQLDTRDLDDFQRVTKKLVKIFERSDDE